MIVQVQGHNMQLILYKCKGRQQNINTKKNSLHICAEWSYTPLVPIDLHINHYLELDLKNLADPHYCMVSYYCGHNLRRPVYSFAFLKFYKIYALIKIFVTTER